MQDVSVRIKGVGDLVSSAADCYLYSGLALRSADTHDFVLFGRMAFREGHWWCTSSLER